jgi:hypothetical protein
MIWYLIGIILLVLVWKFGRRRGPTCGECLYCQVPGGGGSIQGDQLHCCDPVSNIPVPVKSIYPI